MDITNEPTADSFGKMKWKKPISYLTSNVILHTLQKLQRESLGTPDKAD